VTDSSYSFSPSTADLGGTFVSNASVIDYSYSTRFNGLPNNNGQDVQRLSIGGTVAVYITLETTGQVNAYAYRTPIPLKTSMGGTNAFVATPGIYFTVSGQVNYATKTYTVFLNGIAQTVGGPSATTNFPFYVSTTNSYNIIMENNLPEESTWVPSTISQIRYELDPSWSGPITIGTSGTYSGNWLSTSSTIPAVTVATTAPVTIVNSRLRGPGALISTSVGGSTLTVGNCKGYGENPNVSGTCAGRFIYDYNPVRITATNNYAEGTSGILCSGNYKGSQSSNISNNYFFNIDGRCSDGAGGYSTATTSPCGIQLVDMYRQVSGLIAWNKVIEVPNESRVEDTINIYESGGTSGTNPLWIYENYVQGGYTNPVGVNGYTGTGITCGDGDQTNSNTCSAFVSASNNTVVNYEETGMAVYAGHDIAFADNYIYCSGTTGLNTQIWYSDSTGMTVWDLYTTGTTFYNNQAVSNSCGWVNGGYNVPYAGSRDYYFPGNPAMGGSNSYIASPTQAVEQAATADWYDDVTAAGVKIGPTW
jgi:hypothetical protein